MGVVADIAIETVVETCWWLTIASNFGMTINNWQGNNLSRK